MFGSQALSVKVRWSMWSTCGPAAANIASKGRLRSGLFWEVLCVVIVDSVGESHGFQPPPLTLALASHLVHNVDIGLDFAYFHHREMLSLWKDLNSENMTIAVNNTSKKMAQNTWKN